MGRPKFFVHLVALAVVAVWGVTFISTKVLILAGLKPAGIFLIRFAIAYAGIWALSLRRRDSRRLWSRRWQDEAMFVLLGLTGGSFYFLAENTALAHTQTCNVAFLVCSAPLLTALLSLAYRRLRRDRFAAAMQDVRNSLPLFAGTLLALGGMALMLFDGARVQVSLRGDLLALAAALCWAVYSLFMGRMTQEYGAVFATRKVFAYGLLTILPFPPGGAGRIDPAVFAQPQVWGNLLFLGLVASLACFALWNRIMVRLGNVTATNYVYLTPVFSLAAGMAVLGERLTLAGGIGSALILLGVILAGRRL